jgi:hypothetical protein
MAQGPRQGIPQTRHRQNRGVIRVEDDTTTVASDCRTPRNTPLIGQATAISNTLSRCANTDSRFYRAAHCAILRLEEVRGGMHLDA